MTNMCTRAPVARRLARAQHVILIAAVWAPGCLSMPMPPGLFYAIDLHEKNNDEKCERIKKTGEFCLIFCYSDQRIHCFD